MKLVSHKYTGKEKQKNVNGGIRKKRIDKKLKRKVLEDITNTYLQQENEYCRSESEQEKVINDLHSF